MINRMIKRRRDRPVTQTTATTGGAGTRYSMRRPSWHGERDRGRVGIGDKLAVAVEDHGAAATDPHS